MKDPPKSGVYRLTSQVKNPCKVDLRKKYDWEWYPGYPKGHLVVVRKDLEYDVLQFGMRSNMSWRYVSSKRLFPLFEALTANMELVPTESLDALVLYYNEAMQCGVNYRSILRHLVNDGIVRLEQVEHAIVRGDNWPYCIAIHCVECKTTEIMILFSHEPGLRPQYKCSNCSTKHEFRGERKDFEEEGNG